MGNDNFNLDMDKYIKKIRRTRSDGVDYSEGTAKSKTVSEGEGIVNLCDDEIIIEEKEEKGIKKIILSIFKRKDRNQEPELVEEIEINEEGSEDPNELDMNEDELEDFEEKTESIFKRLFAMLKPNKEFSESDELEYYDEPEETDIITDIKRTFKALNFWLEKLPAEEKEKFKKSEDFQTYKSFLKKYNLIKKN